MFNYKELSKVYHIPSDDLFILMSHEIVYEFFELLYEGKKSLYIPIIRENNPAPNFSSLISIKLIKKWTTIKIYRDNAPHTYDLSFNNLKFATANMDNKGKLSSLRYLLR